MLESPWQEIAQAIAQLADEHGTPNRFGAAEVAQLAKMEPLELGIFIRGDYLNAVRKELKTLAPHLAIESYGQGKGRKEFVVAEVACA